MRKKNLCTFLLIIVLEISILIGYFLSSYYVNQKKITEKVEIMYENSNNDEKLVKDYNNEIEIVEKKTENNLTKIINSNSKFSEDNGVYSKSSTSSVSKNNSSSVEKKQNSTTKSSNGSKSVVVETPQENNMQDNTTTKSENEFDSKIETDSPKIEQEETNKSVVIEYNEPDASSFENDPSFIKLKKELFSTMAECKKMGTEVWKQDKDNVAHSYCQSEYYKGAEAGIRLYIVYNDGTIKEYKK